ncbi:MAG TPA: PQQ-binding-like beta-propeller repeat protein [Desulfobaccales bacterium]|nr:PQQ-binding-like beta-propeller repeat protein [Desulfobaccales bacterium]
MKIRKFFSVFIFMLALGVNFPGWGDQLPLTEFWSFTGVHNETLNFDLYGVPGSPAVGGDGTVYAGSLNGCFLALYPDGNLKWVNVDLGGGFGDAPAIADNGIIYASNAYDLFAFDPDDGSILHCYGAPCQFAGAPAIAKDGTVYIGSNSGRLFAFTPELEKKWEFFGELSLYHRPEESIFANPVIGVDGNIYCIQERGRVENGLLVVESAVLHSITPDGEPGPWRWFEYSLRAHIPPAIAGDSIYVAGIYNLVHSVSIAQGTLNWSQGMMYSGSNSPGAPVIRADGTVYVAFGDVLYGLHPTDGTSVHTHVWPEQEIGSISTPAIGAGGKIYFGTYGSSAGEFWGRIYCISPGNDYLQVDGQVHSSPAIVKDGNQGVLFLGCGNSLSAFIVESPGIARSPWPMDRANLRRNARVSYSLIQMLLASREKVIACNFPENIKTSLVSKLAAAQQSLEKEKVNPAKNQVEAFINEVRALKNKKIMAQDADSLINSAQRIVSFL